MNSNPINSPQSTTNPDVDEDDEKHDSEHRIGKSNSQILSAVMLQAKDEKILKRLIDPKHRNAAKLWSKLSRKMNLTYPSKEQLKCIDINQQLMSEIQYSMRHSFCVYQAIVVGMKSEEIGLSFNTQRSLLKKCFEISDDDILMDHCTLKLHNFLKREPSFYLIVDHKKKKIVLSIRGTASLAELFIALNSVPQNVELFGIDGFVHEGMLQAAYFIQRIVSLELVNVCDKYKDYGVIFCGHSLGGGIAALLGLVFKDHPIVRKQNRLKVYAFASPCIASKTFADCKGCHEYITSIALSTDLITRLSVESVRKCHLRQDLIMEQSKDVIRKCMTCDDAEEIDNECAELLRGLRSLSSCAPAQELYPLGRILWFVPNVVIDGDVEKPEDLDRHHIDGNVFVSTWNSLSKGAKKLKESITTKWNKAKRNRKYNGDNYILCDASSCRYIFQELVFDLPECIHAHEPARYLWACDVTVRK
eukprot:63912_1